jgi:hypothetical protein
MPFIKSDQLSMTLDGGAFTFSGVRPERLGATEYTLVGVVCDVSGSVINYADLLTQALKDSIKGCNESARADNLLVRVSVFNNTIRELHGFETLRGIDVDSYKKLNPTGMTNLYGATFEMVKSISAYAQALANQGDIYDTNAIVFVITDGMNNIGGYTPEDVKKAIDEALNSEFLESILVILIGVNLGDPNVPIALDEFRAKAGITKFQDIGKFDAKAGAKLAEFISKSSSNQSQALGSGGPSQVLSF